MKDNPVIEEIIDGNKATEQEVNESIMIDNFGSENLDDNQSWTQVSKGKKGKQKEVPKTTVDKTGDNEDNESVTSYVSENNYQAGWRNTINANKYKIWTLASKIPGKNIGEKIEKIKKIFSKEKSLISVTSEYSANNRMITAFFSNENAMQEARKLDLGDNETQPTHMHRAQVFKRNVEKEKQYGVKLWDIPVGIKYKEIKIELELKYGPIERLSLRVNNMWQSAVVIFKTKEDANTVLENWSILIGEDSLRVTPLDVNIKQLMTRGTHAARVIGLPPGITARELWPYVEKIGAKTCYFSRNRNYQRRREAVISFVSCEARDAALDASWVVDKFTIKIVSIKVLTCHRCYSIEHLAAQCPRTVKDAEYRKKNVERVEKFGDIYKKHNPRYFSVLSKQTSGSSYAEVTKRRTTVLKPNVISEEDRLTRIEDLLTDISNRLSDLEAHVWQKADADVEDQIALEEEKSSSDEEMYDDSADTIEAEQNPAKGTTTEKILTALNQVLTRMSTLESKVYETPSGSAGSPTTRETVGNNQ